MRAERPGECGCRREPVRGGKSERAGSLRKPKSLVIGLTGGVATGKTTVAQMFAELGAQVVSADEIVHDMLRRGSGVWESVVHEFGEAVLGPDGDVDRQKLASEVFADPEKRARLEAITHPPVLELLAEKVQRFRSTGEGVLILEVPLLVETSSLSLVDKVLVVTAEQETQIRRLQKRYGLSREDAIQRVTSQLPMPVKLKHADWVITAEGTLSSTRKQVETVWRCIQKTLA